MTALERAVAAAMEGISWERPCLIWVADYLLEATGHDFAAEWRGAPWGEPRAMRELARLAMGGHGTKLVERAMDAMARRQGWEQAGENRQGAIMIGAFNGVAANGSPAIFDGTDRWLMGVLGGGLLTTGAFPDRAWEIAA